MAQAIRADELEDRLSDMLRAQSESTGRVDEMARSLAGRQAEMARSVNERLEFGDPSRRPVDGAHHAQHDGEPAQAA